VRHDGEIGALGSIPPAMRALMREHRTDTRLSMTGSGTSANNADEVPLERAGRDATAEHPGIPASPPGSLHPAPTTVLSRAWRWGRRTVEDRHGVSPLAWSSLQNLRYQGPEQRSRKLPKPLSRVQHDYGESRRANCTLTRA
jgi:hypothetical protein